MGGDFEFNNNAQVGFEFIYHANNHLLLTIHGTGCYYAYIIPDYYDSLIANFKTELQELIVSIVNDSNAQQTTIEEVQVQFNDAQADQKCMNKDIFVIEPDFLRCNFESSSQALCAWHLASPGDIHWEVGQGQTPTILTGPENDHTTSTVAGKYLFIEANDGQTGDFSDLISPLVDFGSGLCLQFWYNMNGNDVGSLNVSAKSTTTAHNLALWSLTNNQGHGWKPAEVTVPAAQDLHGSGIRSVRIHIRATRGPGTQGDIAIDDISSTPGACTHSLLQCTFDFPLEPRLCQWKQVTVFDHLDWTYASKITSTLSGAGPINGGWNGADYLLMNGPVGAPGDRAELQSPVLQRTDPLCLHFFYYMKGSGVGELDIILLDLTSRIETTKWSMTGTGHLQEIWQQAWVTITSPGPDNQFQIFFRATRGSSAASDIAIDDVSAQSGMCQQYLVG